MFIRCILFLFFLGPITAEYPFLSSSGSCSIPKLNNGRVKVRQRARLVRFMCSPRYTLVGNKYATCRNGQWDVPIPVCISTGCPPIPPVKNSIQIPSYDNAWIIFFCLPGYKLKGSESIFCDGRRWNTSAPTCVDSKVKPQLSCSFEDPDLCGWTNSELHDFDWERLNEATPSSFLKTGPSYDHTFGKGGSGYYMYIETTSRYENDAARLISPVYDRNLLKDGCFSFFYHMYGNATGGLKVYIKPDFLDLEELTKPGELNKKYNLFEKWGNLGDIWFNSVIPLPDVRDNFQIVIEGIRGSSFTSDIAIDDVAILQGSNCTSAEEAATTPPTIPISDSCVGRCLTNDTVGNVGCSCSTSCFLADKCCFDFFDMCIFLPDSQSEKLIATTPETTVTSTTTSTSTTTTTTPKPTTTTTTTTTTTSTTPRTTIKTTQKTTTIKANSKSTSTTTQTPSTIKPVAKTTKTSIKTTPKITTIPTTIKTTTQAIKTTPYTTSTASTPIPTKSTTNLPYGISRTIENHNDYHDILEKARKEKEVELRKSLHLQQHDTQKSGTSGWKILLIIISVVACMGTASWLILVARSSRGRAAISRLRGHVSHDPEVRFLSTDVDDD